MLSTSEIKQYLKNHLKEKRYIHTLGVSETAVKLAQINNLSSEKAEIAALAHDAAKNMPKEEMQEIMKRHNVNLSEDEKRNPELWHSIIAPYTAQERLGIEDEEILDAVRWHTTGKENMSVLAKIIYIADMIEPNRNFPGLEEIRKAAFENLDRGVYLGLTHSLQYLLSRDMLVNENTIKARNYILIEME